MSDCCGDVGEKRAARPGPIGDSGPRTRTVAVVGPPNTGKSTFFNRLTGASARVANWPGMTVDVTTARVLAGGAMARMADLPGIYTLDGHSDDEALVRTFLSTVALDAIVVIVNASRIELQLPLALAVKATGVPVLLVVNMADEATKLGIAFDAAGLSDELRAPVVAVSAKYGQGMAEARRALERLLDAKVAPALADLGRIPERTLREREAARLVAAHVHVPATLPAGITAKLDRALLHRWLGVPLFFVVMFAMFQLVFGVGVPLQDAMKWLLDALKGHVIAPLLANAPPLVASFVQDGLVDGVGTVFTFVPLMAVFFAGMARDRGLRLSLACGMADGRIDGPPRARRPVVRHAAHGLRLQRARADGDPRAAQPRRAPPVDAGDPVLAVLCATAGVFVHDHGDLQSRRRADRALLALRRELRGSVPDRGAVAPPLQEPRADDDGIASVPASDAAVGRGRSVARDVALPASRERFHRRRRRADLGADAPADRAPRPAGPRRPRATSPTGCRRSSSRSASIR